MNSFLITILIFALAPIIAPLIFSEIMAAKEGDDTDDFTRKFSKFLGWVFFILVSIFLMYIAIDSETARPFLNFVIKIIVTIFDFLK
jgi:uncharacterized membrane protein